MILQRLIQTNVLFILDKPYHSIESAILTLVVALISLILFIFWNRKKALLNFQAWALLMCLINLILFFHFCPVSIHITYSNLEYQFTSLIIRMLMALQYITTVVTIWKLWKLSEKYIPKDLIYQIKFTKDRIKNKSYMKRSFFIHSLAIWHTIKNGGNNDENNKKIRKNMRNIAKTI